MALKGLDIFKLTPKTNCKECGSPTCMAFAMKVAQGAVDIAKCPHMSDDALATLSEATAPPMKTIKVGTGEAEYTLGGETVLFRHEKTYVSKSRYAVSVSCCEENMDAKLEAAKAVDYDRIGERMHVEMLYLDYCGDCDAAGYAEFVKKAAESGKTLVLGCTNVDVAKAALDVCKDSKPILDGADASNYEAMSKLAAEAGVVLGVRGGDINELYDTVAAIEKLGNKNLVLNVGTASIKDAFATTVQIRRAALKNTDRTFGYPSIVNVGKLAPGDAAMQAALASLFTVKYGSVIVMESMIYALNGADENSVCLTTVDFALTYFVVSGELERSGVPCNLVISDAGGLSVLTAWAAGKLSSTSVSKFIIENVEPKVKSRKLIIPGKVAVLKGDIEAKLPGWEVIVAPNEAVQLVKFLKDMQANGEI